MHDENLLARSVAHLPNWRLRAMRQIVRLFPRGRNVILSRWAQKSHSLPEVICETACGFKMAVNLQEQLARDIFFNGIYEPVTAAVIEHLLQPGDIFFDVGANQGQFSLLGAQRVGKNGTVYSFEPNGLVRRLLEQSIVLNRFSNVHIQDAACVDKAGLFVLQLQPGTGNAYGGAKTVDRTGEPNEQAVKGINLDEFVAEQAIDRIDLMKMDIEGGEAKALIGMQAILKRRMLNGLIIEFHPELGLPGGHEGMRKLARQIVDCGYTQKQLHEYPPGLFSHYQCRFSEELLYTPKEGGSMREVANPQYLFQRIGEPS